MKLVNLSALLGLSAVVTLGVTGCPTETTDPPPPPPPDKKVLAAPTLTTDNYRTADQMILANEINESGEPFAEALGYDLDLLDPAVPGSPDTVAYTLGIENYEYSRYQLGTVITRSGLGLHMMWAPIIGQMAAMEDASFDGSMTGGAANGVNEDDELVKNIMNFSRGSGHAPPGKPWPQFAEFVAGDPRLPQAVDPATFTWEDFSSLRWDRSKMDKTLNPAAIGQTLMKQYLWASDMLSAYHDGQDNGIDPIASITPDMAGSPDFDPNNDVFLGGDSLDGFIGQVLTAEAINKVAFLKGMLSYDGTSLGAVDPATYDPVAGIKFFPHAVAVTEGPAPVAGLPPMPTAFSVTDGSSHLFDQASLLWGTSSFTNMANPGVDDPAHLVYAHVFDGNPFPPPMSVTGKPGPYDLFKGVSKVIFMNLMAMHFDPTAKVFVDVSRLNAGAVKRDEVVSTVSSAYLLVSLEGFIGEFAGTPLEAKALQAVQDQAAYLVANLSDGTGNYYDATTLGAAAPTGIQTLEGQSAAVRGLFVAARITGDTSLKSAAEAAYQKLLEVYYVKDYKIFLTEPGKTTCTYTPRTVAILSGAFREAAIEGGHGMEAAKKYVDFFQVVAEAMQLSEGGNTGELGGDSDKDGIPYIPEQPDGLPPVFATQAVYQIPQ